MFWGFCWISGFWIMVSRSGVFSTITIGLSEGKCRVELKLVGQISNWTVIRTTIWRYFQRFVIRHLKIDCFFQSNLLRRLFFAQTFIQRTVFFQLSEPSIFDLTKTRWTLTFRRQNFTELKLGSSSRIYNVGFAHKYIDRLTYHINYFKYT